MPDTGQPRRKRPPRFAEVARCEDLTPHMRRIVFTGPELANFPEDRNGGNIKLFFPEPGWTVDDLRAEFAADRRPTVRTYTARRYDPAANELLVDFVIHADGGPASSWAAAAGPGDFLAIAGPSDKKLVALDADWFLVAADMSAMPAACAALEELPADARGQVFFEIPSPADEMPVATPEGMSVTWLVHDDPHRPSRHQLDAIRAMPWPGGRPSVFVAGESGAVKAIREHLLGEGKVAKEDAYFSGYWKIGLIEDEHQVEKRREAAEAA